MDMTENEYPEFIITDLNTKKDEIGTLLYRFDERKSERHAVFL